MRLDVAGKVLGLTVSIPVIFLWSLTTLGLRFRSILGGAFFTVGSLLPFLISYYGFRRKYSPTILTLLALGVLGLSYRIIGLGYIFSGYLYSTPIAWCVVLILSRERRGGLAILTLTLGYFIALSSYMGISIVYGELLGLGVVAILETCFRALLGPTLPLTRIYFVDPSIYALYSIASIGSLLYVAGVKISRVDLEVLREASKNIFYASMVSASILASAHLLLPLKHSLIVYPTLLGGLLSYVVFRRLRAR